MTIPGTSRCSDCRKPRAAVRLDDRVLCDGCADRRLASTTGWPELLPAPPAEIIAGVDGRRHLIGYRIMRMPGGITAMAEEIGEELAEGYRVELTIDHDGDQAALPDRLRAAVHSAIGRLYLQPDQRHGWGLAEDEVAGRLVEDVAGDGPPGVVVDGRPVELGGSRTAARTVRRLVLSPAARRRPAHPSWSRRPSRKSGKLLQPRSSSAPGVVRAGKLSLSEPGRLAPPPVRRRERRRPATRVIE